MSGPPQAEPSAWADAALAAALFAIDPVGLGGVRVRSCAGPVRDRWLSLLRSLAPHLTFRRVTPNAADDRLFGGLDLAATLAAGRPIAETGLLAALDGGVAVIAMAERLPPSLAARLAAAMDAGAVVTERDGLSLRSPSRFGIVALDEGVQDDERPPGALVERLAFQVELDAVPLGAADPEALPTADAITAAQARLAHIASGDDVVAALCSTSAALGIETLRAPLLALRAARAAAALAGCASVSSADTALAARLVLAPRARFAPAAPGPDQTAEPPASPPDPAAGGEQAEAEGNEEVRPSLDEVVLAAAAASIPAGLLASLNAGERLRLRSSRSGRVGKILQGARRGRPNGVRRGEPGRAGPLSLVDTLRAAAPWQPLRRIGRGPGEAIPGRIDVRREDFRVTRFKQRSETTTIFVVDASGSSAFHRLAEVKGAVELLLADCYVRRDSVALIAFRGFGAELLLPPTRSLVRAKRSLAHLPGGGPTPLAAGIAAALGLADATRRKGGTPLMVLMTDGRGNTTRDGGTGRDAATADALAAARAVRAAGTMALLVDISPKPRQQAEALAAEMGARYLPLPHADATLLSAAIRRSTAQLSRAAHVG